MSNLRVFVPFAVDSVDDVLRRFLRLSRLGHARGSADPA
jgi:hypothetical protein